MSNELSTPESEFVTPWVVDDQPPAVEAPQSHGAESSRQLGPTSGAGAIVHGCILAGSLTIIAFAFLLDVHGEREMVPPGLNRPLPGLCVFRRVVGVDCPGCGLTRSFVSLANGDLAGAWKYNPAVLFAFPLIAIQIPYRSMQLARICRGLPERDASRFVWVCWPLILALFGQWAIKLILHGP